MSINKKCYNCDTPIEVESVYCKICGQKIDNNDLSISVLVKDFVENYLSLDTRFGRSIVPFLFKPGLLTNKFISGKRLSFANPFKSYLFISIFFFFSVGLLIQQNISNSENNEVTVSNKDGSKTTKLNKKGLVEFGNILDSLENVNDSSFNQENIDSLLKANNLEGVITIKKDSVFETKKSKLVTMNKSGLGFNIKTSQLKLIDKYRFNTEYTDAQLLDSIEVDRMGGKSKYIALQSIRLYRSDSKLIMRFFLGNFSFALLFLIPILALLFMLFFRKNKMGYVKHLIHSLHIHTFSLFLFALGLLFVYFTGLKSAIYFVFILTIIYWYFSIRKVYDRTVLVSISKLVLSGVLYYFMWTFTLAFGAIISFLLF